MGDDHRPACESSRRIKRRLIVIALMSGAAFTDWATNPGLTAAAPTAARGESTVTSVFVFHRRELVSSHCDTSTPNPIDISEAYSDVFRLARPLSQNVRNGITMTVRWRELPTDAPSRDPDVRVVTEVVQVGQIVPCDIPAGDRPLRGTQWVEIEGDTVREHGWTLLFEAGKFRAGDGCNGGGGPYRLKGNEVTFGWFESTLIVCISGGQPYIGEPGWLSPDVPYTFTIRGRVMQMASPTGTPRTFIAKEWD